MQTQVWFRWLFLVACLAYLPCVAFAGWVPASKRDLTKVRFDEIKALTFYRNKETTARRTDPIPQLQCIGKPCAQFQPNVVQCVSRGDRQWRCEAELPHGLSFGAVRVSCEGWKSADDEYVLRGSCGLKYELIRADASEQGGWASTFFLIIFWSFFVYILLCCLYSIFGPRLDPAHAGGSDPNGPAPPPYPGSGKTVSGRPGFWTGLGLGALAARLFGPGRQSRLVDSNRNYGTMPPYGPYDPYYGSTQPMPTASGSDTHTSAGFGGTDNR